MASIDAFRRDPRRVWRWYGPRIAGLLAAEPNAGHVALAALERAGHVRAVVTQNIDLLHTRAGTRDVIEVHGSIARFPCLACHAEQPLEAVLAQLETREAPICEGCGAILKPGVVMFGELLPVDGDGASGRCSRARRGCSSSSGRRSRSGPSPGLPADAVGAGGALAIVNLEETPYDAEAEIVVRGPAACVAGGARACARCDGGERVV